MKKGFVLVLVLWAGGAWGATVSQTGDALQGGIVRTFTVPEHGERSFASKPVTLVPMTNWPQSIGVNANYAPSGVALSDVNGDDTLEVIVGSTDNILHVFNIHGNELPGWPKTLPAMVQAKVAVGDLFGNGQKEIVVAARNGMVYVYKANGDTVGGWPQNANGVLGLVAPTLSDLNGDDSLEVIMPQMQSGQPGHVYIWKANGQAFTGWPQNTDYLAVAAASVADVDADGVPEICEPSYRSLYLWDRSGTLKPGWPRAIGDGASYAQPELYDLDGNGQLEIGHSANPGWNAQLFIYRPDSTFFPGWPQPFDGAQTYICPVAGGLLSDTVLSLLDGGHLFGAPALYAWDYHGNAMNGWSVIDGPLECSPIVFDVEGNGRRAAMIGDNTTPGNLYAYYGDGNAVTGFPVTLTDASMVNSPAVGDVDLDGITEVAHLTKDGTVNLWKVQGVAYHPYLTDWGTMYHDNWNTGWFHPKQPSGLSVWRVLPGCRLFWRKNSEPDIAGYQVYRSLTSGGPYTRLNQRPVPDTTYRDSTATVDSVYYYAVSAVIKAEAEGRLSSEVQYRLGVEEAGKVSPSITHWGLGLASPNPFSSVTRIAFSAPRGEKVSLRVYDVSGRLVRALSEGVPEAKATWDGRDEAGRRLPGGVYFYRLESSGRSMTQKVVITR